MSRMDSLPPDQRAALSLLLSQRKSYAEVAALLQIPAEAVHDRAQAALAVLAPGEARSLTADERAEVGDYLLGQSGIADRLKTRTYLSDSEAARTWALAVAGAGISGSEFGVSSDSWPATARAQARAGSESLR